LVICLAENIIYKLKISSAKTADTMEFLNKLKIPLNIMGKLRNKVSGLLGVRRNKSFNTPSEVADAIRFLIEGKTVCDIGCDMGHFMQDMSKYAKVVGIEVNKTACKICRERGLEVYNLDVTKDKLPDADVYYTCIDGWLKPVILEKLKEQGKKGLYIMRNNKDTEWNMRFGNNYLKIIEL
jgi:Methionine biosynthesis protein MetW